MSADPDLATRRVLVISDDEATRVSVRDVLDALDSPSPDAPDSPDAPPRPRVDSIDDPTLAFPRVREALIADTPYSMAIIALTDDRGLELAERLLLADRGLQVVLCRVPELATKSGAARRIQHADRLVLLRTPIDADELHQLSMVMIERWSASQRLPTEGRAVELERANRRLMEEVAQRREMESLLRHHAFHDTLTGLANRSLLKERLEHCIALAGRDREYRFAVLFLDIDNFKIINDSLGHDAGDDLLVAVTGRLLECMRDVDTVVRGENIAARLGGDEFVIVLEGLRRTTDAANVCERVLEQLGEPFDLNGHEVTVSASIGVAMSKAGPITPASLLRDADIAMYRAKSAGKARYALFDRRMHEDAVHRLHMENDLRRAVERSQFRVIYHPIVSLASGRLKGFEALVRWDHPDHGTISPDDFIPVAEETGLVVPIGEIVLEEACRQLAEWDAEGVTDASISMNVNLSRRQLLEPGLIEEITRSLSESGLRHDRLNLEITESAIIRDADAAEDQLLHIKRLGVRIQMDDFGTGYSSLSCLHRFPLNVVKIDRSFLATMEENRDYAAIIHGIVDIAHNLGMRVTIEGVEKTEQLAQVLALDCDFAQGYLFSKPLPPDAAKELLQSHRRWQVPADSSTLRRPTML